MIEKSETSPSQRLSALASAPRFLIVGGLASLINWLARFPLSLLMPFWLSVGVAYGVGMVVAFLLYSKWVFPYSSLPVAVQIFRFIGVNLLGLATVMLCAKIFYEFLHARSPDSNMLAEGVAHALAIAVGAVVNFIGHRTLTFSQSSRGSV